jgi:superfamily I DNA and/or RNA helicase
VLTEETGREKPLTVYKTSRGNHARGKYNQRQIDVIIIITTVVNETNDFVDNPNLPNVAISRALERLIVVVSDDEGNHNSNTGDLIRYIEYNNF